MLGNLLMGAGAPPMPGAPTTPPAFGNRPASPPQLPGLPGQAVNALIGRLGGGPGQPGMMQPGGIGGAVGPGQAPPSQQDLQGYLDHTDRMMTSLLGLTGTPEGQLTKRDVFGAAADLIKGGSFATPDQRSQLVSSLAGLPDDEGALRQFIGQHLLSTAMARQHITGLLDGAGPQGGGMMQPGGIGGMAPPQGPAQGSAAPVSV